MLEMFLKRMRKSKNQKGFTLVELIVVIAILGILAAVAIGRFGGFTDSAKVARVSSEHKMLVSALQMHKSEKEQTNPGVAVTFTSIDDLADYLDGKTTGNLSKNKDGNIAHELSTAGVLKSSYDTDELTYDVNN